MKAKVMTAYWEKDQVEMKLDSIMEVENIEPSYSRITPYDADKDHYINNK